MPAVAVNYTEIDPPVVGLVRAINELPGVRTFSSCGGHENPGPCPRV
jgi:tRNA(Phe) wybutosine-synthesizing methylase Tyw3